MTREECPLCDSARPVVAKAVRRAGGTLQEIDVDSSTDLAQEFGERVPVVLGPDDAVLGEGLIDRRALVRKLKAFR